MGNKTIYHEDFGMLHIHNGILYKLRIDPKDKQFVYIGLRSYLDNYAYWNKRVKDKTVDKWGVNGELLRDKYKDWLETHTVRESEILEREKNIKMS